MYFLQCNTVHSLRIALRWYKPRRSGSEWCNRILSLIPLIPKVVNRQSSALLRSVLTDILFMQGVLSGASLRYFVPIHRQENIFKRQYIHGTWKRLPPYHWPMSAESTGHRRYSDHKGLTLWSFECPLFAWGSCPHIMVYVVAGVIQHHALI